MSTTMTLTELQTAVRQRADQENSQFVSDSELTSYINQSYFELYDLIVTEYGNNYYAAQPVSFQTDGLTSFYALPNGTNYSAAPAFYKLLGVDLAVTGTTYVALHEFQFLERNNYQAPNQAYMSQNLRYRLQGDSLWLTPLPSGGQTIKIWYVPRLTTLTNPTDVADGISGWTEYVVCDAAMKCMQKEESDVSILMAQKAELIKRIRNSAQNRNASEPACVTDVHPPFFTNGYY